MPRALTLIFFVTLIGCDSDGGAITPGGQPPPPPPPGTGISITAANAVAVSGAAWGAVNNSADMVGLIGNSGLIANNPGGVNKATQDLIAKGSGGNTVQGALLGPLTLPCVIPGGSVTISGDIADQLTPTLSPNDIINVDYDNCDDDLGEIIDGLLEMTIVAFTGDMVFGPYDLTATLTLTNFQVTTAADSILTNGAATTSLNTTDPMDVSASVSGSSMTTAPNTYLETLTDFQTSQTVDIITQTLPYTMNASGTVNSSLLTGIISYATDPISPFTGFGVDYPSSGEILISAENSSARIIAVDNVDVEIHVDNNGDDQIDEVILSTWVELTAPPAP